MPGRSSSRSSTLPGPSRTVKASRISSPTIVIPDEGPSSIVRTRVCGIFGDAQKTTAGHRKLVIGLRKIQVTCCDEEIIKAGEHNSQEDDFNFEMARCVIRIMGVKKSEPAGDRLIRFLGLFLRHANEKDAALVSENGTEEIQSFPETSSTRLTSHILSVSLPLMASKEKTVRYRSTQLIAHIINSLESIDDEQFHLLKIALLKRLRDKEPVIRVQAVLGLGRLAGNEEEADHENEDSDEEVSSGLLDRLFEVLQNDPSADVRRSLLLNLPLTPETLPFLLERARDLDPATRRALYSRLLPALGDFRHLSLSMREKLLRWGLRDRDENVRKATASLFRERWLQDCAGSTTNPEDGITEDTSHTSMDGLLELLERIDVVNSGVEHGIALEAMKEFWDGRPDYRDAINFDDSFWDHLTSESVFMARSFNDFCKHEDESKYGTLLEEKMPEVTRITFILQRYINNLVECLRIKNEGGDKNTDTDEQEFIVEQLLHIASMLDYSDEVGRRKMFGLLRETLAIAELPDEITRLVVDVLRDVCGLETSGEREFCDIVLEAIAEIHDTISFDVPLQENEDESFHSAQSEISDITPTKETNKEMLIREGSTTAEVDEAKAIKEIMVNMKCLHIAQCMLQNVEGNLQHNLHLVTTLNNLVVPAVRSHEAPIRERGLLCLGLCCLLDKNLAEENITLFLHCYNKGHEALQVTALQVITDILTTYPILVSLQDSDVALHKSVLRVFSKSLKAVDTPEIQAAGTVALCKLMLTNIIQDGDLLKSIVLCYFNPVTKENAAVRQALSYFLPVYCYSRRENMERMAEVVPGVLHGVLSLVEEMEEEEEMVGIGVVGSMLVDWTDARKLVVQDEAFVGWDEAGRRETKAVNGDIHLGLAETLLEKLMGHGCTREEKKSINPLFGKLYINANSSKEKLRTVQDLLVEALDMKIATDAPSRNSLNKLQAALTKVIAEAGISRTGAEGATAIDKAQEEPIAIEDLEEGKDMKEELAETEGLTVTQESLLEELLQDEEEL